MPNTSKAKIDDIKIENSFVRRKPIQTIDFDHDQFPLEDDYIDHIPSNAASFQ